jgi:hypothetical protein
MRMSFPFFMRDKLNLSALRLSVSKTPTTVSSYGRCSRPKLKGFLPKGAAERLSTPQLHNALDCCVPCWTWTNARQRQGRRNAALVASMGGRIPIQHLVAAENQRWIRQRAASPRIPLPGGIKGIR